MAYRLTMGSGKFGVSMNLTAIPARRKRRTMARRRQEKRWAAKAGPVMVRKADDDGRD